MQSKPPRKTSTNLHQILDLPFSRQFEKRVDHPYKGFFVADCFMRTANRQETNKFESPLVKTDNQEGILVFNVLL